MSNHTTPLNTAGASAGMGGIMTGYGTGSAYQPPSGIVNAGTSPQYTIDPFQSQTAVLDPVSPINPTTTTTKTTNMGNITGGDILKGVGVAAPIAIGLITRHQANKEAEKAQKRAFENQQLLAALESSRQEITNPYANLSVATQAAEFQAEQADIALANTLDTLRATGAGAGGATALAQAALKSKQGISANIEQQEVKNEQLKAQGEQFVFQTREAREMQKLDRTAGLIDRDLAQEAQYRADALGALTGGLSGASQMATALYSK